MKIKNTYIVILFFSVFISFLNTGCVSVKTKNTVQPIVDAIHAANEYARTNEADRSSGFVQNGATRLAPRANLEVVTQQLKDSGLYDLSVVQKLVSATANGQPFELNNWEAHSFAKTFLDTFHTNAFNGSTNEFNDPLRYASDWHDYAQRLASRPLIEVEATKPPPDLMTMFEAYYVAYINGQFTLRDGTVLGKPTANLSVTNGSFQGAIPNDTVDGIITVFSEAINDALLQTPLFYGLTTNQTYTSFYVSVTNFVPRTSLNTDDRDGLVQLYHLTITTKRDYFLNGKTPTAAAFLPCYQVVAADENGKTKSGLTQEEVQFIRTVSGLTAKQSQALGTLIFQTWGGGAIGQFAYLHISVGNNQILSSIVQNLLSSVSYHASEKPLTLAFWDYNGKDPTVNALLDHYEDLISIVQNLSNQ